MSAVDETLLATLSVPQDHAIFSGHFPGMPLVPGVMLLDWTLREAARALATNTRELRIRESKFFSPLRPGETADLSLTSTAGKLSFRITRNEELLASGVLEKK